MPGTTAKEVLPFPASAVPRRRRSEGDSPHEDDEPELVLGVEPDAAEVGRRNAVGLDPGEPGVIERVQGLGPELELDPLPDGEILVDRDVPVLQGRKPD